MKVKKAENGAYKVVLEKHDLDFLEMADTEEELRIRSQLIRYKIEDEIAAMLLGTATQKTL